LCDIELGDIGDIGQSQCHNPCEREKKATCDIVVGQCHQFYVTQVLSHEVQHDLMTL